MSCMYVEHLLYIRRGIPERVKGDSQTVKCNSRSVLATSNVF